MAKLSKVKSKQIIKSLLEKITNRFKQEFVGENDENLNRVVLQHRGIISRTIIKNSQRWSKWKNTEPVLMPDYTRIYYRKGETEVVLQEFPPQFRSMKFTGALVSRDNTDEEISEKLYSKIHYFYLPLPYTVFIFKFTRGEFSEVKMAFSDRPLKTLEEKPFKPYLSNIDSELKVCLGREFEELRKTNLEKDNVYQQVAFVLSHFWQTVYSDEWAANYWNSKRHFANDERLNSIQNWEKAGGDDSLFVVENVNWLPHEVDNFADMIVKMFESDKVSNKVQEEIYKEIIDNFLNDLKKSIEENINSANNQLLENMVEELAEELISLM